MTYPLLPYSQLVFDMLKTNPDVYRTHFALRLNPREVDIEHLKNAIEIAIRNHPVFFMQVDEQGRQSYVAQQNTLHGRFYSVDFSSDKGCIRMDVTLNRILGDAKSVLLLIEDVCRAYRNLPLVQDNYLAYLAQLQKTQQSTRYIADHQWLEAEFGDITCPVHPKTDIPLETKDRPLEGTMLLDYTDLRESLYILAHDQLLPLTAVFSLACALAIMEYNGTDEAALTWAYEGRERPEEQRIFGSLHRDIPFKINNKLQITSNQLDLLRHARKQYREGIAHSSYPLTLTKPHTDIWNYALNVLEQPMTENLEEQIPFPFELIPQTDTPCLAYALLDVEIMDGAQLLINFRYSATHYKTESIHRFAVLVRKYTEWLTNHQ